MRMNIQGEDNSSDWEKKKELGQGGFGYVWLYRNKITDEYIAVKKLRMREEFADASNRVWERWKQEVYIMHKLDHNNVIRAVDVPPELDVGPEDIPALGMEYCKGGDLRQLLMQPENCQGLREVYIRDLLSCIGSAIEYLHNKRIIHRDIKPENVVLQPTGEEHRFLFKIIDLGYAKELDASSCCISHVGTQQYLAPELYSKQAYTRTVDYWSFGSVVFECITGHRPFLPDYSSVQWHKEVSKKSPDDITAFQDGSKVKFSKKLLGPTHLCRPMGTYLEQWLKLMLRWDSKSRGGGVKKMETTNEERPKCFCVLEQIIEMKIFHVLFSKANLLLSFPVNESHTIEMVHQVIKAQTEIPVEKQLLINRDGYTFHPRQLAKDACQDSSTENPSVFLFCQGPTPDDIIKVRKLPATVELIVKEPLTVLPLHGHKEAWKNVVYFCANENFDYKQSVASKKTAMMALLRLCSILTKQKTDLNNEMIKLLTIVEFFKMSLDFDIRQLEANESLNQGANGMYQRWQQSAEETSSVDTLKAEVDQLQKDAEQLSTAAVELQKPSNSSRDLLMLEDCEKDAKKLYERLRSTRGQEPLEHGPMVNIVGKCLMGREELSKNIHDSIDKVMELYHQIRGTLEPMEMMASTIQDRKQRLVALQQHRQEDIWKVASHGSSLPSLNLSADTSMNPMSVFNGGGGGGGVPFLQSLSSSPLESMQLMDDTKTSVQKVDDVLDQLTRSFDESMQYFSTVDQ